MFAKANAKGGKTEVLLVGQDNDEARAAVKLQRELKKKHDTLRKLEKKLKSLKTDSSDYAEVTGEVNRVTAEIAALEGAPAQRSTTPTAVAPGLQSAPVPQESEEADAEEARKRLSEMILNTIHANTKEGTVLQRTSTVIHPRVAEVAIMMEAMLIVGGNARTLAMISAFRELIKCTTVLSSSALDDVDSTAFEKLVEANFSFLCRKREASSGMRYVKEALVRRFAALREDVLRRKPSSLSVKDSLADPRELTLQILGFIEGELTMSLKSIVEDRSLPYVSSTDTILVFGRSSVVELILLSRARDPQRKPKMIIVVDAAPLHEGRLLSRKLADAGINVTYGLITACCTLMPKCTRVFIGASSVLQNGDVFGRCGTALIAACAKQFRKPVLCFSESYKFVPEVWLGNLAQNTKLMDIRPTPESLGVDSAASRSPLNYSPPPPVTPGQVHTHRGPFGKGMPLYGNSASAVGTGGQVFAPSSTSASGYLYDLTPAAYVDMIICEMGCLHTSAIVAAIKDREGRDASPLMYLAKP